MPDFNNQNFNGQNPYEVSNRLEQRVLKLEQLVQSEQFSDRYRFLKRVVIGGRFQLQERDNLESKTMVGELSCVSGQLYFSPVADTWVAVGSTVAKRSIAAGTASDSPTAKDGLIRCSTSAGQALTITLPEAADNIGLTLTFTFVTDGGQNVTINRTGSDVINESGDLSNTAITMDDATDTIQIMAVQDNIWLVVKNVGCSLT